MDQILRGEACFYQGIFILHQGYHDDYACFFGGVAMSGGNGMYSSTQVSTIRRAWARVATFYCARN
jgi:hypothetical protein